MLALAALVPAGADAKLKTRTFSGPLVAGDEGQATGTVRIEVKVKAKTGEPKQLTSATLEQFQFPPECFAPSPPIQFGNLDLRPLPSGALYFEGFFGSYEGTGVYVAVGGKFNKKATVVTGGLGYEYFESQESPNYCKVHVDFELTR
jgi:hypothetical protein